MSWSQRIINTVNVLCFSSSVVATGIILKIRWQDRKNRLNKIKELEEGIPIRLTPTPTSDSFPI